MAILYLLAVSLPVVLPYLAQLKLVISWGEPQKNKKPQGKEIYLLVNSYFICFKNI